MVPRNQHKLTHIPHIPSTVSSLTTRVLATGTGSCRIRCILLKGAYVGRIQLARFCHIATTLVIWILFSKVLQTQLCTAGHRCHMLHVTYD